MLRDRPASILVRQWLNHLVQAVCLLEAAIPTATTDGDDRRRILRTFLRHLSSSDTPDSFQICSAWQKFRTQGLPVCLADFRAFFRDTRSGLRSEIRAGPAATLLSCVQMAILIHTDQLEQASKSLGRLRDSPPISTQIPPWGFPAGMF